MCFYRRICNSDTSRISGPYHVDYHGHGHLVEDVLFPIQKMFGWSKFDIEHTGHQLGKQSGSDRGTQWRLRDRRGTQSSQHCDTSPRT